MVSIYEAEICGKRWVPKIVEDQLTSRVFGALAMLPPETVLLPFLRRLAKDTTPLDETDPVLTKIKSWKAEDVQRAEIHLWEYIDKKCPDVCIMTPNTLIVIEAKTDTKPDKEKQIEPQFREAREKANNKPKKELAYFLLTREDEGKVAQEAQNELKQKFQDAKVHWRSWTQVWEWLRDIEENLGAKHSSFNLLDATIKLLEARHMNIKGPTGFKEEWFGKDLNEALDKVEKLCDEISTTMNKVIPKAEAKGIRVVGDKPHPKSVIFRLSNSADSIQRHSDFYFRDKKWGKVENPDKHPSLFISFGLETDNLGITVGLWWPHPSEEEMKKVEKEAGELVKILGESGLDIYRVGDDLSVSKDLDVKRQLKDGEQSVKTLVEELDKIRIFTNDLKTLRKALGYKPRKG